MARMPGALFCSLLLASLSLAQNPPAQKSTSKTPSLSMPMVAPVFLEDAEFTSTLTLVNDAIQDLSARVLVLDPYGVAAAQKEFHLPGHTSLPVRIHDLLEESGSAVTTGSVIVMPQPMPGMPIGGQLSITSRAGSIPSYIEEEMLMPDEKTTPGMYRTSALAVKGSPIMALKSLAQTTQTVTLECFSEKAAPTKGTVQLPSGESIIVAACDVSQTGRAALSEAMSDNPAVDRGAVGVAITTTAPSGDLIGYGFAAYRDDRGWNTSDDKLLKFQKDEQLLRYHIARAKPIVGPERAFLKNKGTTSCNHFDFLENLFSVLPELKVTAVTKVPSNLDCIAATLVKRTFPFRGAFNRLRRETILKLLSLRADQLLRTLEKGGTTC
jgi:hypothetical protein